MIKKKKRFFSNVLEPFFFRKKFQKFQNSRFVVSDLKVLKNLFFSKKSYFHRSILKSRSPTSEILKSSDFGKKIQNFKNFKILVSSFSDLKFLKKYFFSKKSYFSSEYLKKSFPKLRNLKSSDFGPKDLKIVGFCSKFPRICSMVPKPEGLLTSDTGVAGDDAEGIS